MENVVDFKCKEKEVADFLKGIIDSFDKREDVEEMDRIRGCILIPYYADRSVDVFYTTFTTVELLGIMEIAKNVILAKFIND